MAGTIRPGTGKLHAGTLRGTGKLPRKPSAPPKGNKNKRLPNNPIKVPVSGKDLKSPGGFLGLIGGGLGNIIQQLLAKAGKSKGANASTNREGKVGVTKQSLTATSSADANSNTTSTRTGDSKTNFRAPAPNTGRGKQTSRIQLG